MADDQIAAMTAEQFMEKVGRVPDALSPSAAERDLAHRTAQAAGSITRSEVIERGHYWTDRHIPYSQSKYYPGPDGHKYRTDCSGFVSMAWKLGSSETTVTLPNYSHRIDKNDLKPGDILLNTDPGNSGHVVLFEGWADAGHTSYIADEESGSKGAVRRVIPYPYYPGHGTFRPYRYDKIAEDTQSGVVDVQIIGSDSTVWDTVADYKAGKWSGSWTSEGRSTAAAVASASTGGTVHTYAVGPNGRLYSHDRKAGGGWTEWSEVPGGAVDVRGVSAAARGNAVDLMIIGSDGSLYGTTADYGSGKWAGAWGKVGDNRLKAIASSASGNVVHVFAVNEDGRVYNRDADYNVGRWTEWGEVPGGAVDVRAITAAEVG
ncbi:hypothetical protein [Kitasatospora sp. NPDC093806]|uniref:hypothetical protein n=1 Tax=Kitasatospora sp. NPDC093806 TaxID=3155075 RepID=UPI0034262740